MNKVILDQITRSFNLEELRTLCFDLNIHYDALGGEGLIGKARELLNYAARHDMLPQLMAALRQARPAVAWPEPSAAAPAPDPPPDRAAASGGDTITVGNMNNSIGAFGRGATVRVSSDDDDPDETA